jgi:hypothetical protein
MLGEVLSRAMFDPVSYDAGYKEGFTEGVKHAQDFIEKSAAPNVRYRCAIRSKTLTGQL